MKTERQSERGGAQLKFLLTMVVLACTAYAGYLYIPVAYRAHVYQDLMQHYADVAGAQGYKADWVGQQLTKSAAEYEIPSNAVISTTLNEGRVVVRVQYTRPIEFPGYTYVYEFDHTVKSTAFLDFK